MPQQVVVVTGASAGVGRAVARAFARQGARVALLARGLPGLEAARHEVEALGGEAMVLPLDVADADAVEAAAGQIERALGPIDVWVNNAMVTVFSPFSRLTADEFRRVTEVTYLGSVWGTMAALRRMRERDRGTIVQVGSALAYRGIPLQAPYCGAKHALMGMVDSVRTELLHDGSKVRISVVQLPAVNTPQFDWCRAKLHRAPQPVPPIYQPEVAARTILRAAATGRREYWVGQSTVNAIVGNKLAPAVADRVAADRAWEGQLTEQPVPSDRPDNLFHAVDGDWGAHGRFDDRASGFSLQAWASRHRGGALAAAAVAGVVLFGLARRVLA